MKKKFFLITHLNMFKFNGLFLKNTSGGGKKISYNSHNNKFIVAARISIKVRTTCRKRSMCDSREKLHPASSITRARDDLVNSTSGGCHTLLVQKKRRLYSLPTDNILIIALRTCFLSLLLPLWS